MPGKNLRISRFQGYLTATLLISNISAFIVAILLARSLGSNLGYLEEFKSAVIARNAAAFTGIVDNLTGLPLDVQQYVSKKLIIKFNEETALKVDSLLSISKDKVIGGIAALKKLHKRYPIKAIQPLLDIQKQAGESRKDAFKREYDAVKFKFSDRSSRTGGAIQSIGPDLSGIYVMTVDAPDAQMSGLAQELRQDNPDAVAFAEPSYIYQAFAVPNDPFFSTSGSWGQQYDDLWALKKIHLPEAWEISVGSKDITIAVVDTGIDLNHDDIKENIWHNVGEIPSNTIDDDRNGFVDDTWGWDFSSAGRGDNNPVDDSVVGHGTHVAGTIGAVGNNNIGVVGVNWSVALMAVKGFTANGLGTTDKLAAAIKYAADNGADVMNFSWGGFGDSELLKDVVSYAHGLGIVMIAAAGNDNADVMYYTPAHLDDVITVSSTTHNDEKSSFSNWGARIDVAAPGSNDGIDPNVSQYPKANIVSLRARTAGLGASAALVVGGDYLRLYGTSMATPHVSGLAALILSRYPKASNEAIRFYLQDSADDIGTAGFDTYFGYGRLNAYQALKKPLQYKYPELITTRFTADKKIAEQNSPVRISITVENPTAIPVQETSVVLFDGEPNQGTILKRWGLQMKPNDVKVLETYVFLTGYKKRTLSAVIDPNNLVQELNEDNNKRNHSVLISPYQYFEKPLVTDLQVIGRPDISGDIVVFQGRIPGTTSRTLYTYNLKTGEKREVITLSSSCPSFLLPRISGNDIVWADLTPDRTRCDGVYVKNLQTNEERYIGKGSRPDISGDNIVFERLLDSSGASAIFLYNLSTGSEQRLSPTESLAPHKPSISKKYVSWEMGSDWNDWGDIYLYNLDNDQLNQITSGNRGQVDSQVSDRYLVWEDYRYGTANVFMYDIDSREERQVSTTNVDSNPALSGTTIVWDHYAGFSRVSDANIEIYEYDVAQRRTRQITMDDARQDNPVPSDSIIVWLDSRLKPNKGFDIFGEIRNNFPQAPKSLTVQTDKKGALLRWEKNAEDDVRGYMVYRVESSDRRVAQLGFTAEPLYFDTSTSKCNGYSYFVTAIDQMNGEGSKSNEISVSSQADDISC